MLTLVLLNSVSAAREIATFDGSKTSYRWEAVNDVRAAPSVPHGPGYCSRLAHASR